MQYESRLGMRPAVKRGVVPGQASKNVASWIALQRGLPEGFHKNVKLRYANGATSAI